MATAVRIVAISDTHGQHRALALPPGDILVHAGDLTTRGRLSELDDLNAWFATLPFVHIIYIAGNHDWCFQKDRAAAVRRLSHAIYLEDSGCTLRGLRFYGSPWQPEFFNWAFNLPRGAALAAKWAEIPPQTDVLLTHGPPRGYGDRTVRGDSAGCADLTAATARSAPRLHVFGHIHEGYGQWQLPETHLVNASSCTVDYAPTNPPVVVDLVPR